MRHLRIGTFTLARPAAPGAANRLFRPSAGCLHPALLAFTLGLAAAGAASADDPSKEFWPEIDAWARLYKPSLATGPRVRDSGEGVMPAASSRTGLFDDRRIRRRILSHSVGVGFRFEHVEGK